MYMTPNGRIVLSDEEKKAARMVQGINVSNDACPNCFNKKDEKEWNKYVQNSIDLED